MKRAVKQKLLSLKPVDLRKFGVDARQTVDGRPYGGGLGMVLRADVLFKALKKFKKSRIIMLTPQGKPFTQREAARLSKYNDLVFVCGRYEGFDERAREFVDEEFSIGDYVLMGGEMPALVMSEAIMRLRAGVLGKDGSAEKESFSENLLEYPQYTKPEVLKLGKKKMAVPKVLLSGNHQKVDEWRLQESLKRTKKRRPDLFQKNNVL